MKPNSKLIYSPKEKIPIGEPVILPDGSHNLRLKWKRGKASVTEIISLDKLHELIVKQMPCKPNRPDT